MDWRAPRGAVRVAVEPESPTSPQLDAAAFDYGQAEVLARELGLQRPTAVALVRRGLEDIEAAREFLAEDHLPEPTALTGVKEAVGRVLAAHEAGKRITVFGDFDVDGVCATAILIEALRGLGAQCDWLIPDRLSEGYGLSHAAIERLAGRGTGLLITVDCGITGVDEVAAAQRLGLEVIVTDHHQPGDDLPSCLLLHPGISDYSCPNLCGAGVAWKLASALGEAVGKPLGGEASLDLVALATVADLVPLLGENRVLVKRGLTVARRAARPGLRALLKAAGSNAATINETDLGFRLAPRVNAAGRLYRADAGVELFLTRDDERAAQIAEELSRANQERRDVELRVLGEAETALRRQRDAGRLPAGLVVSGEGWHPGVIGIVASRLVELHRRPAVVIAIDEHGGARGSGRSVPGFDLLAALHSCGELLGRFGGHRAAAGLELDPENIEAFGERFSAQVVAQLGSGERPIRERVDAFAAGPELGLGLAEELEKLGPFGIGNPGINLVIPSARVVDRRSMGSEGDHMRFTVESGGFRARGVAFARKSLACEEDGHADLVMRLERNEWNGSIEPRLRLRELVLPGESAQPPAYVPEMGDEEWWQRFEAALRSAPNGDSEIPADNGTTVREVSHQPGTGIAVLAELLTSGASVLAVTVDAGLRAGLAQSTAGVGRFAAGPTSICSLRDGRARLRETLAASFGLTDYRSLLRGFDEISVSASGPRHVALIDPPASPHEMTVAKLAVDGSGMLHRLWDPAALSFALRVLTEAAELRAPMAAIYRALREGEGAAGSDLRDILQGSEPLPDPPERAGSCVAILSELGLVGWDEDATGDQRICARRLRAVSSNRTDLDRSSRYRNYRQQYEVKTKFLQNYR